MIDPENFYGLFSASIRELLCRSSVRLSWLQEVRLRAGKPLLLHLNGREVSVMPDGTLTPDAACGYCVTPEDIRGTLESISGYSLYAFDEELRQGFLTVQGGHRIGVTGKVVMDGQTIGCIRHISFLNVRLAHEVIGCADSVITYLTDGNTVYSTLILSAPGCGKTTLLRDLIRQISNGTGKLQGHTVGVVDERSEIAGAWQGIPQNDIGIRTDVLDCCPKTEGMRMLLRAMSPQVIAVDELGGKGDAEAVENVFRCGCRLIATAHGSSLEDVKQRRELRALIENQMFERYVVLKWEDGERVAEVLDKHGCRMSQDRLTDRGKDTDGEVLLCGSHRKSSEVSAFCVLHG